MIKNVFIITLVVFLMSCQKTEKKSSNYNVEIIPVLKNLDIKMCLRKKVSITYYNGWKEFAGKDCIKNTNCRRNKKIIFAQSIPEKLLKEKHFILIHSWDEIHCPENHACTNDSSMYIVLDAENNKVIETPASKNYKRHCSSLKLHQ